MAIANKIRGNKMACRCEDINKMKADLKILDELKAQAAELAEYDSIVQESLAGIADVIDDTLITPVEDNVHIKLRQLNNESDSAIEGIISKIEITHDTVNSEKWSAFLEDAWWHITHPIETIFG